MNTKALRGKSRRAQAERQAIEEQGQSDGDLANLVNLQARLFDLIVNNGNADMSLPTVVEEIRQAFSADGAVVTYSVGDVGSAVNTYTCSTDTLDTAIGDHLADPSLSREQTAPFSVESCGTTLDGTYWCEEFCDGDNGHVRGAMFLVFSENREPLPKDRLVLKAITPLLRFVSASAGNRQALKSANDSFSSLADSIPGVVYQRVVKPDGEIRYTYISETAEELFGVPAREIISNPNALFGTYAPEYARSFRERLIEASRTLSIWDVEASIVAKDGTVKYTHAIAKPAKQPDGSVLWTGVIMDATRIKEAEIAAAVTEARTREAIVNSLSQGFLLFDTEDRLILQNGHFIKLFPDLDAVAVNGAPYEEILRAELASGYDAVDDDEERAIRVAERLALRSREGGYLVERRIREDCWIMVDEHRTPSGETVILYTDVSEIKKREERIQHMAHHDALTGLPNRVLFQSRVKEAIEQARANGNGVAVACLDLDHFKNVNDTLGHPAGDALLCTVAERIRKEVREADTVARLGGDEFAIVFSDFRDPEPVHKMSDRILNSLALPINVEGHETITGASIGIALMTEDAADPAKLLKNADLALYRAKSDGRNKYRFFEKEMDEAALARRKVEVGLRLALELDQLELYFQPLVNIGDNSVSGFEALVRWNHPELGVVSPDDFIGIAEDTGLIVPLGEWVLRKACESAAAWAEPVKVAVNISPTQFRQANLVTFLSKVLSETALDPGRLELEITESVLMRNTAETMETLHRLKGLGVRIAMDDFGTGYSSLGNLRSFPFDKIKIDRSFVSELETNPEAAAIVRAVVGLGRSLGIDTTAEGVETRDQLVYLRIEGCSEIQGFYYSQPRPEGEVSKLLTSGPSGMESDNAEPDSKPAKAS